MYNEQAIQTLIDRIGWSMPIEISGITLTAENLRSDSGRFFDSFHKLVTVHNVYDVVPMANMPNAPFNVQLYKYKRQAVLSVLNAIFDDNLRAHYDTTSSGCRIDLRGTDYSGMIIGNASVFDQSFGRQMVVDILQLERSSARSNSNERLMKEFQNIDLEIEGYYDRQTGKLIAKGARALLKEAIEKAIAILFPDVADKNKSTIRNRSYLW